MTAPLRPVFEGQGFEAGPRCWPAQGRPRLTLLPQWLSRSLCVIPLFPHFPYLLRVIFKATQGAPGTLI